MVPGSVRASQGGGGGVQGAAVDGADGVVDGVALKLVVDTQRGGWLVGLPLDQAGGEGCLQSSGGVRQVSELDSGGHRGGSVQDGESLDQATGVGGKALQGAADQSLQGGRHRQGASEVGQCLGAGISEQGPQVQRVTGGVFPQPDHGPLAQYSDTGRGHHLHCLFPAQTRQLQRKGPSRTAGHGAPIPQRGRPRPWH